MVFHRVNRSAAGIQTWQLRGGLSRDFGEVRNDRVDFVKVFNRTAMQESISRRPSRVRRKTGVCVR